MSKIPEGATHIHNGSTAQYKKLRTGSNLLWLTYVDGDWFDTVNATPEKYIPIDSAWDGVGLPPVGTVCEVLWNESLVEYLRTKVFGVNEHGQPIHRFDEGPKKYQYQADVLRTASGTQVFRPIRTAEQIAAEEREKAVNDMVSSLGRFNSIYEACGMLYDENYRKQVEK